MTGNTGCMVFLVAVFSSIMIGPAEAQHTFKEGYVVMQNSDTIVGLINVKSNSKNASVCEFKYPDSDEIQMFSPAEITSYKIENSKLYVSKQAMIEDSARLVFLEYLINGIVDLYYLKQGSKEYYFIDKEGVLHELSNEKKLVTENDLTYEKSSNQYIGVLKVLFQDSPELYQDIGNTEFAYRPLIKITKDYHNLVCTEYECIDYTKSLQSRIWIEPLFGIGRSKMTLKGSQEYDLNSNALIGVSLRIMPSFTYFWSLNTGLIYSKNTFGEEYISRLVDDFERLLTIELNYSIIRIPIGIEYWIPSKVVRPFVSAGINNCIILNPEYSVKYIGEFSTTNIDSEFRKYNFGFTGSAGIKFFFPNNGYISIKGDYEYRIPSTNTGYVLDYATVNSFMISLGYGISIQ